jgi:hypothetical protein
MRNVARHLMTVSIMDKQIDKDLFEKAISDILLEVRPVRQTVTNSTINFFDKYAIPKDLQDLLTQNSFDRPFKVGHIHYSKTNNIEKYNLEKENINCINEGLLIIGSGLKGTQLFLTYRLGRWALFFMKNFGKTL